MGNYTGGANTICPYYEKEAELSVTCSGVIEGSLMMSRFTQKESKMQWQQKVCSTFCYDRCPIAIMIESQMNKKLVITDMRNIVEDERAIYDFIVSFTKRNLYPPSIREICKATNYSVNSTKAINLKLDNLNKMGLIEVDQNKSRAIKLVGYKFIKV